MSDKRKWALGLLLSGVGLAVAALFFGRYVGLVGRADQELMAVVGVVLAASGTRRLLEERGLSATKSWLIVVPLTVLVCLAILLPDLLR